MPRRDDEFEDDDRPRRRRPRDDDEDDDRPARSRRRDDDEYDADRPRKKKGNGLLIGILVGVFVVCCGGGGTAAYFIFRGVKKVGEQVQTAMADVAETTQSRQNLMQIGRAVHQYSDRNNHLPNNSYAPGGKPLLSWRVHILPQLGQDALYRQFKLDEPWDSPTNRRLLDQMPLVYGSLETQKKAGPGKTFYRGFHAPGGIFEKPPQPNAPAPKIRSSGVPDGLMNTILVVDAGEAVEWTKPDDLDFGPGRPRPTFGGAYPNLPMVLVLMADGSVRQMNKDVPDETLRRLIDRRDGNIIPPGWGQ